MDSRDSRSEDASGVSLRVIDKEHFNSAKELVVRRAKGAGKAVEGTSHPGNGIAAAHEGGAVLNSEKFEVSRQHERCKILVEMNAWLQMAIMAMWRGRVKVATVVV